MEGGSKAGLEERQGLVQRATSGGGESVRVARGTEEEVVVRPKVTDQDQARKGSSSRSSRKSFRLDYRLEEEVTPSARDRHGRFMNPWPDWRFPSYSTLLRFFLLDKDNSNVPSDKDVSATRTTNPSVYREHQHPTGVGIQTTNP